jgi:hypothetical protein
MSFRSGKKLGPLVAAFFIGMLAAAPGQAKDTDLFLDGALLDELRTQ